LSLTDKAAGAATRKRDQWVQGWPSGITSSAQGVVGQGEGLAFRSRSSWLEDFALFHLIGWLFPLFVFGFSPKKKKRFFFGFSPRRCVLVPPSLCWLGGREGEGFLLAPGLTALVDFFPARPSPCSTPFWSLLAWLVFWGGVREVRLRHKALGQMGRGEKPATALSSAKKRAQWARGRSKHSQRQAASAKTATNGCEASKKTAKGKATPLPSTCSPPDQPQPLHLSLLSCCWRKRPFLRRCQCLYPLWRLVPFPSGLGVLWPHRQHRISHLLLGQTPCAPPTTTAGRDNNKQIVVNKNNELVWACCVDSGGSAQAYVARVWSEEDLAGNADHRGRRQLPVPVRLVAERTV
jgi:hypothetical protein